MSWACGWCIAFNDECCQGKIVGCSHGKRCVVNQEQIKAWTERASQKALAEVRHGRKKAEMTGRIRKAWEQLDEATDEIVRRQTHLNSMISAPEQGPAVVDRFRAELDLVKARARGKAEILALIMPAPLHTSEAISQEAGRRWQARQRGVAYGTPGIRLAAATVMDDVGEGTERFS